MNREYVAWHSPSLNRKMEMLVFGHSGARIVVFPTSKGKYFEWEDQKMMTGVFREGLERGWFQIYAVDSVDAESWYCYWAHPGGRAYRHHQYFDYIHNEVLPFSLSKNQNPFLMMIGASFGAFHALSFALKYPNKVDRVIGMSGLYDIRSMTSGYSDDFVYFNNPMQFVANEYEEHRLAWLRHLDIILAVGKDDPLLNASRQLSSTLWSRGIGNALREWNGWSHDWPYWSDMLSIYLNGHD